MRHLLPLVALSLAAFPLLQAEDAIRIAKWQGDRAGAFVFSFDDGQREQVAIAAPLLVATIYNIPLTVVITSGAVTSVNAKREGGGKVTAAFAGEVIHCDVIPGKGTVTVTWK